MKFLELYEIGVGTIDGPFHPAGSHLYKRQPTNHIFSVLVLLKRWAEELGRVVLQRHDLASSKQLNQPEHSRSIRGEFLTVEHSDYHMQQGMQQPMLRKQYSTG